MSKPNWVLPLLALIAVLIYSPGLQGPFLFDDAPHISQNTQVHIPDLSLESLNRAWHSSYAKGVSSRPLSQLTFGVNHALGGLDPEYFKTTNLTIHLLNGLLIFALARRLTRVLARDRRLPSAADTAWPALLITALWLLNPLNLTPVLYVVQRMTSLSALLVLAGLWCYVSGRLRMADGDHRGFWLAFVGFPIAGIGILAKESAALYPLFVLVLEWTLLRGLKAPRRTLLIGIVAALPLALGLAYFVTHPGLIGYGGRAFTLEERVLTEARVLWLYLRMLFVPDLAQLGLFHDDIPTSVSLTSPWTTLPALAAWLALLPAAILGAKRWPLASFAMLFYLAGHALESTVIPLELIFEHRNYLPSFGPLFAAGVGLALITQRARYPRWLQAGALLYVVLLATVTHLRAWDWSSHNRLVLTEAEHHPDSARANFSLAKLLISSIPSTSDKAQTYALARYHLERLRELAPDNLDVLFALVVLNLHVSQPPEQDWIDALEHGLRNGVIDPTHFTTSQFSYLVQWHMAGGYALPRDTMLGIFSAVLANPRLDSVGRAGILSALRAYYVDVLGEPEQGLVYARDAVRYWPQRWHYQKRLVELLVSLGRLDEAKQSLAAARRYDVAGTHTDDANRLQALIAAAVQSHAEGTAGTPGSQAE